uniref:Syntaxin binding protein 6 n=1 Tax=Rattus norvegicus TaxID=10116 RepID=A0A8I5ZLL4_RAT
PVPYELNLTYPLGSRPAAGPRALGYRSLPRARSPWLARSSTGHAHRQRRGQIGFASSHSAAAGQREAAAGALAPGVGVARSFPDPSLLAQSSRSPRGSGEPRPASSRVEPALVCSPDLHAGQPRGSTVFGWDACRALGTARARARLHVTNKKPTQASITKVKQFEGSTSFVRRSQWMLEQLRQVNGIDPNRDSAEFDLLFENAFDQWVASTASEKCTFFQILHHTCQRYLTDRKPEFINCQSKIMGGNSILHSAADSVTSAVQKASQALNERGERLGRAEEKTEDMKNSAQQFAETAHKLAMKHKC